MKAVQLHPTGNFENVHRAGGFPQSFEITPPLVLWLSVVQGLHILVDSA